MNNENDTSVDVAEEANELEAEEIDYHKFSSAVVFSADWTTETLVSQLERSNIGLNPRFQRRDAWDKDRKSRFVESLVLGLPIPQIVLAEDQRSKGKYLVLDGKQRLLTLLQFWGKGQGLKNAFALSGLTIRKDLVGKDYAALQSDPELADDLRTLQNQPIRTVVIRNWPNQNFLHVLFLRLNTGSVRLSPQELRQALYPGPFSDYVDDRAANSEPLQKLLGLSEPDYRMRDVELLARHIAFIFFLNDYKGRMKSFLDMTFDRLNTGWAEEKDNVEANVQNFERAIGAMLNIFETKSKVARKPNSKMFNKAIFDGLTFYLRDGKIRDAAVANAGAVRDNYDLLFKDKKFLDAIERDTASTTSTAYRLERMGKAFATATGLEISTPQSARDTIAFGGFAE